MRLHSFYALEPWVARFPPASVSPALQSDALFRAAADQAPQVMWIVNPKGAVTYLNQAWYALVGGAPPKWYGHEWGDTVLPEDLADMRLRWKAVLAGAAPIFEGLRRVKAQDGTIHQLSYKATPVRDATGRVTCWVGMDADITEMVATEAALRFANRELEAFSYSVSHDLRAPLVTLQGFSTLLARHLAQSHDQKALHYLSRIGESVQYMGRLVDGLLALTQVARSRLRRRDIDLAPLARTIVAQLQRRDPGRVVQVHLQPELWVQADSALMTVLLENLLSNAWKFTAGVPDAQIWMEMLLEAPTERVFVIRDNGVGFDMAHVGQLFGAFQRLHADEQFPGSGVGLATVQRIVARHGGRVWAEAEPGHGASIFFALPASPPESRPAPLTP